MAKAFTLLRLLWGVLLSLTVFLAGCGDGEAPAVGDPAPDFALPSAQGTEVILGSLLSKGNVLLYFHMGYG